MDYIWIQSDYNIIDAKKYLWAKWHDESDLHFTNWDRLTWSCFPSTKVLWQYTHTLSTFKNIIYSIGIVYLAAELRFCEQVFGKYIVADWNALLNNLHVFQ